MPSLLDTAKKELLSFKSLIPIFLIGFIYFSSSTLIINYKLVQITLFGNYDISYKLKIVSILIYGATSAFSMVDFVFLIITSTLVGLNILMIYKIIKKLKSENAKLTLSVGGSSILGIVVAGCASCGFSVISLLGFAAAVTLIPFSSFFLHIISVVLLLLSLYYSINTYHQKIVCKIN